MTKRAPAMALALCLLPLAILAFTPIPIIDDAFITYRYAYHLAVGDGLVFNPGERVEGSTSLLWTVLLALPIAQGWPVERWVVGSGLVFALLAALTTWRIGRQLGLPSLAAFVAPAILGCLPGYWLVATNGMEGGLTTLLVAVLLLYTATRRPALAGLCGGLLFLARPDSVIALPVCALYMLVQPGGAWRRIAPRRMVVFLIPWLAFVGATTLWRLGYYGAWLPNTVTAKSPPALTVAHLGPNALGGLRYWGGFFAEVAPLTLGGLFGLLRSPRRDVAWLCAGLLAAQLPATLINGGDWIPHHRLLGGMARRHRRTRYVSVRAYLPLGRGGAARRNDRPTAASEPLGRDAGAPHQPAGGGLHRLSGARAGTPDRADPRRPSRPGGARYLRLSPPGYLRPRLPRAHRSVSGATWDRLLGADGQVRSWLQLPGDPADHLRLPQRHRLSH